MKKSAAREATKRERKRTAGEDGEERVIGVSEVFCYQRSPEERRNARNDPKGWGNSLKRSQWRDNR